MSARVPTAKIPALLFGPYRVPSCKVGDFVDDAIYGRVQVNGWTSGPMAWPTRKRPGGGPRSIAMTDELARALRMESAATLAFWLGVSTKTVRVFRRALDVPRNTPGTLRRHADVAVLPTPEQAAKGRKRVAEDPLIRAAAAAKRRGRVCSQASKDRMSAARKGKPKPDGWGERAGQWMRVGKIRKAQERSHKPTKELHHGAEPEAQEKDRHL